MPSLNFDVAAAVYIVSKLNVIIAQAQAQPGAEAEALPAARCSATDPPAPGSYPTYSPPSLHAPLPAPLMQSESVFAFMHVVACVHIYLRASMRECVCVCVTVRMRDAHKMPSENKSLYSPLPRPLSTPLPSLCTQANNSFMYPAAWPCCCSSCCSCFCLPAACPLPAPACCLISVCPSFGYPFLHWGASSSSSSCSSSSLPSPSLSLKEQEALSLYLNVLPPTTWRCRSWHTPLTLVLPPSCLTLSAVCVCVCGNSMCPCGSIISSFIDPIYVTGETILRLATLLLYLCP